jgi:hypothetical protein
MTICHSCHRHAGKHWRSCKANRCTSCGMPSTPGTGLCAPCQVRLRKKREKVIARKLAEMDARRDDKGL